MTSALPAETRPDAAGQPRIFNPSSSGPADGPHLRQPGDGQRSASPQSEAPSGHRLLAAMPLHAITTLYGEAGLRERFVMEIATFPSPDRHRLEDALELAARLHADDRRQREPYLNHLLRVAIRILSHYGVHDADIGCAGLLHDTVEDHAREIAPGGGQQEALAVLRTRFGPRIATLVEAVTNPDTEAGPDPHQRYRDHVTASLQAHPWARVIKASDFTDNGVGLMHTTGPMLARLAAKYAPLVPALQELISRPDTPLSPAAKARILAQLSDAAQRFAAINPAPDTARRA
jgi:hypothetical protein